MDLPPVGTASAHKVINSNTKLRNSIPLTISYSAQPKFMLAYATNNSSI